ncbi:MAG: glycosyltransferase family 39 protein [Vicinamibacterales bacterium]
MSAATAPRRPALARPSERRELALLLALALAALLLRCRAGLLAAVIERDGVGYLGTAARFAALDWSGGFTRHTAPGYPLAIGLLARALGRPPGEGVALAVSAASGAAATLLAGLLARGVWGRLAGRLAALMVALLPLLVRLGGEVLSESLFLALALGALLATERLLSAASSPARRLPLAVAAGLLVGAAYLTRPEGVLVLVAIAGVVALAPGRALRRRAADLGGLALPGLVVVLLFAAQIRDRAGLAGSQRGEWKLTLKRDLGLQLAAATPGRVAEHLGRQALHTAEALAWALPLLALAGAGALARARPRGGAAGADSQEGARRQGGARPARQRRALALLAAPGLLLLAAYGVVRSDPRYAAPLIALLAPAVGAGAAAWLRDRAAAGRAERLLRALALVFALVALAGGWRPARADKASYVDAGAALRTWGARRVLAHDSRAAYYAGAEAVELLLALPEARQRADPAAVARVALASGADAVVLAISDPEDAEARSLSDGLRARWGAPLEVRRPGAVALDLFRVAR